MLKAAPAGGGRACARRCRGFAEPGSEGPRGSPRSWSSPVRGGIRIGV